MPLNTNFKFTFFRFSSVSKTNRLIFALYCSSMFAGVLLLIKNGINGNYYSCYADSLEIIGFLIAMHLFFERKLFFYGHVVAALVTCVAILAASYLEGLRSGTFILFMPVIFVIPFIISRHKDYKRFLYIFYPILAFFFTTSLIISPEYSTIQDITIEEAYDNTVLYASISFFILMVCSAISLLVEKKYIIALEERKTIAIEERNSRTRVLSNLGHELRTQINSINGTTQLISEEITTTSIDDKTNLAKYVQMLDYCNNQMLVLVNDILDLHKIEINKLKLSLSENNISELVNNVSLPFENRKDKADYIEIIKDIDPVLNNKITLLDESRLIQVLHNLLSNALKFTKHGKIYFTVKCIEEEDATIKVFFSVRDTGIGIPKEDQEKIFKSFVQITSPDYKPLYSGTGLGLSISKSIIEAMGGVIKLDSKLNKGSNFYFTLNFPKVEETKQELPKLNYKTEGFSFLKGKSILVAEDNPISMLYTQKLLEKYDVKLNKAVNGREAIAIVESFSHIDLVLLDLEMPVMTGFEAVQEIKKIRPSIKVIAFTANIPGNLLMARLNALGFSDIILKPFKKDEIMNTLYRALVDEDINILKQSNT